jgi:transcriptional regulator with XRE-family HTH domain
MTMFGLGKKRSPFGKWLDKLGISQIEVADKSKVSNTTISKICSDKHHVPKISTWVKIQKALKSFGYEVDRNDFFDM